MFRLVALQALVTTVVALVAWPIGGAAAGLSALLGGLACVVPNALFALRLVIVARRSLAAGDTDGTRHVVAFFFGEFVKVGLTLLLLVAVAATYKDLVWVALIVAVIASLKSYMLAPLLPR
jgi:ATP synthase protein I